MSGHGKAPADRRSAGGTRPAAERVQPKMKVGDTTDPMEREADAVAHTVVAGQPASIVSRMPAAPEKKEQPVRRAAAPEKKKDEPVRRAAAPEKKKDEPVRRAAAPEKKKDEPVRRQAVEEEVQAKSAGGSSPEAMSSAAQHAVDSKGPGRPLDSSVRSRIESSTGADMGHVRVHDDPGARAASEALNARAFTHGSDIWMGPGESSSNVQLMAHEAAHVIQQGGAAQRLVQRSNGAGAAQRLVQRNGGSAPAAGAMGPFEVDAFALPTIKNRHRPVYERWSSGTALKRAAGYDRDAQGDPRQRDKWANLVQLPPANVLANKQIDLANPVAKQLSIGGSTVTLPGTAEELTERLKLPDWDRRGLPTKFEVDHIVELQVSGWPNADSANEIQNMEMLDKRSNASAGGITRGAVRDCVRQQLVRDRQADPVPAPVLPADVDEVLANREIVFKGVGPGPSGSVAESDSRTWSRAEIEAGHHLQGATPLQNVGQAGTATSFALLNPARTRVLGEFAHGPTETTITLSDPVQQRRVAGLCIQQIVLVPNYTDGTVQEIGSVQGVWDLPPQVVPANTAVTIPLQKHSQYAGYLGNLLPSTMAGSVPGASPIEFSGLHIEGERIVADGRLSPTIPLIANTPLELRLVGRDIELAYTYNSGELSIPIPGLTINDTSLTIFFGTRGLGAEGSIEFTVNRVGGGRLTVTLTTERGFEASGLFSFDTKLFDVAEAEVWYRNREFGGRGTLRITNPDKIRGIRSAEVTATFSPTMLGATGTIVPSIPGIENVTLTVQYSEEEGLLIGGAVDLGAGVPGISSGTLDVQLRRRPGEDEYAVSATGTAVPAIPGLDTTLTVSYNEGALTIAGSADYSRGMLSGSVQLGATNRVLDATGTPTDEVGTEMRVYGGGTLTVRVTPWLQGTVGVRFLPNGELELTGTIALPDTLDIFPEKRLDRNIFSINLDIPILGFAVAGQRVGIFATIGGGLDLSAGIGPGQLRELGISITYNPSHEDQTHIHGGAKLVIPAHAGLRLFIRGALGAGIPIVSASLGLEVGGQLGLEGAVEASVDVDWTPSTGLVLDALGEIYVQPKFRFDLTGFLTVDADLFVTTINLYEQRWELAAFELGPDLRFGVRFPIHYQEGQPFDISMDDLQFEVPDVDTDALLGELIDRIV